MLNKFTQRRLHMDVLEFTKREEGYSEKAYYCTAKKLSIGYGWNLEANQPTAKELEVLINGSSMRKKVLFEEKLSEQLINAKKECQLRIEGFSQMPVVAQEVLVCMCFQMGIGSLLNFKKTLAFLRKGDLKSASVEMLDSKWHNETPSRARKLSTILTRGYTSSIDKIIENADRLKESE